MEFTAYYQRHHHTCTAVFDDLESAKAFLDVGNDEGQLMPIAIKRGDEFIHIEPFLTRDEVIEICDSFDKLLVDTTI